MKRVISEKWIVLASLIFLAQVTFAQAKTSVSAEKFYAYSIYNFSLNTKWDESVPKDVFKIAVVGNLVVYNELSQLTANRKVGNSPIRVTFFKKYSDLFDYNHIVFLSTLQSGKIKEIKERLGTENTLIVTEREGMGAYGSCVSFYVNEAGKIHFELSSQNFEANKLKVSAKLITLAEAR